MSLGPTALLLLFVAAVLRGAAAVTPEAPRLILIVLSSEGRDGGKTRPGFEAGELARAGGAFILKADTGGG